MGKNKKKARQQRAEAALPLPPLSQRVVMMILAGFALLILLERAHTYSEPFDRDLADYAVTAHQLLHGYTLYGDYMDQKPPGIHVTYALAELVAGYGRPSIFLLNVTGAVLMMLALYKAGSAPPFGTWGGIWSAGIWTLIGGHLLLEANQPNSELFLNLWTTLAIAGLAHTRDLRPNYRRALWIGLCFAAATLYKHSIAVVPACVCGAYLILPPYARKRFHAAIEIAVMAGVVVLSWALVYGYFAMHGRGQSFKDALILYNQGYAGDMGANLLKSLLPAQLFPRALYITIPLVLLIAAGFCIAAVRTKERLWLLLIAWGVGTEIAVALPGRFYPHYYQLWLPVLITGAGWSLASLALPRIAPLAIGRWTGAVILAILAMREAPGYLLSPAETSLRKYNNDEIFVGTEKLGSEINRLLEDDETFFQLGAETQLYLETKRNPPRMLADYGLDPGPLQGLFQKMTLEDLERDKPELLVISPYTMARNSDPVVVYCLEHYRFASRFAPFKTKPDAFIFYVRKGGALEKRWAGLPEPD